MQKIQKVIVGSALALGLLGGAIATGQTAEASQGYIMEAGRKNIVGVWVEVKGGTSGWAKFSPTIRGQKYSVSWSYNTQNKPLVCILASGEPLKIGNITSKQDFSNGIHTADK
jgi:hypothetical protein